MHWRDNETEICPEFDDAFCRIEYSNGYTEYLTLRSSGNGNWSDVETWYGDEVKKWCPVEEIAEELDKQSDCNGKTNVVDTPCV